jgi:hypothetical protein
MVTSPKLRVKPFPAKKSVPTMPQINGRIQEAQGIIDRLAKRNRELENRLAKRNRELEKMVRVETKSVLLKSLRALNF